MICADCGHRTDTAPCPACGADPLLAGRWRLEAELGRGTSGTTFRAVDTRSGDTVAVKEMPIGRASSAKARELLGREARILGELDHPAIPRLVTSTVTGTGRAQAVVLVQEYVDGVDLRTELATRRYDPLEVLHVAADLLEVLGYLHRLSPPVVHRDLKPANVIRRTDGRLVLVDFGAVRDSLRDLDLGGSTVAGTFGYMAPEQLVGDASPMSDLYGLGALLVHLLTRTEPQQMLAVGGGLRWQHRAQVPPGLQQLLDDLLQPDPDLRRSRLQSTEAVHRRVLALIADPDAPLVRATPRNRLPAAAAAVLGLGALAAITTSWLLPRPEPDVRDFPVPPPPDLPVLEPPTPPMEPNQPAEPVDLPLVDVGLGDLPPIGSPDAPVHIVAFFDYQCPFCARALTQLEDLVAAHEGEVAVYLRDFPLGMHPEARERARLARCAARQGHHREVHDARLAAGAQWDEGTVWTLARQQGLALGPLEACLADPAVDAAIDADQAAGTRLEVNGTPTLVVDGERVVGAPPMTAFEAAIARARAR
ncbi:MAG: thioredoxin domain-containing protein [Myxococcota bacterium]